MRGRVGGRYAAAAGVFAVAMAIPMSGTGAVAPKPGLVYSTETAQLDVVNAEVNPARNRVVKFQFSWSANCTPGPAATPTTEAGISFNEYRGPFAIKPNGTWSKTIVNTGVEGANRVRFVYTLKGLRTLTRMTGSIRVRLTETDPAGAVVRTCDTGVVRYAALERQRFGGLTAKQRNLMSVRTNVAGTRITRVRWDWDGTCVLGPAAKPETPTTVFEPDFITQPVQIRPNGTFNSGLRQYSPFVDSTTGNTLAFENQVKGKRTGKVMTGTVLGRFVETDTATGQVIRSCTSRNVAFSIKD